MQHKIKITERKKITETYRQQKSGKTVQDNKEVHDEDSKLVKISCTCGEEFNTEKEAFLHQYRKEYDGAGK